MNALGSVAVFGPAQLEQFHERAESLPRALLEDAEPCLRAAAMFHTEVAVRAAGDAKWALADYHADAAWRWSRSLEPAPARKRFHRDWLLLMGWVYQDLLFDAGLEPSFSEAERYFDRAVEAFPDDAEVLLSAGALFEWSGSLPSGNPAHLKEAERYYERAVGIDPADPVANLRYGVVLNKRGRWDEASGPLERALSGTSYHIIYRARLGLGALAERAGELDAAIAHYREAVASRPTWQPAYLALSHALHVTGAREQARDVLDEALALRVTDDSLYGYWSYEVGLSPHADALLTALREEATF